MLPQPVKLEPILFIKPIPILAALVLLTALVQALHFHSTAYKVLHWAMLQEIHYWVLSLHRLGKLALNYLS